MTEIAKLQTMGEETAGKIMEKKVCRLTVRATIHACVYQMIRYRAQSVLLEDSDGMPRGLVTKRDVLKAFFNGFHPSGQAESIMNRPGLCEFADPVESLLMDMTSSGNDQWFVRSKSGVVTGIVTSWIIIDMLFRSVCRKDSLGLHKTLDQLLVNDVMTDSVPACFEDTPIQKSMDVLMKAGPNAVLITDIDQAPVGVLSLTDINRSYIHCVPASEKVGLIMGRQVLTCLQSESLADSIRKMDVLKYDCLFVTDPDTLVIQGVLALSDVRKKMTTLLLN